MKTTSLYIAALLIAGAFASCQKDSVGPDSASPGASKSTVAIKAGQAGTNMIVHYQVGVYQTITKPTCGSYAVEITNAAGVPVAAPQPYVVTKIRYFFSETVKAASGIRIARLVTSAQPDGSVCPDALYTQPDVKTLGFQDGKAYFFYLYPSFNSDQSTR